MKRYKLLNVQAGFTLVETLVAVVIVGLVGTTILGLYTENLKTYTTQLQVTEAQQNVRAGLDSLVFDLRMAGFDPTSNAGAGIVDLDPDNNNVMDSIHFTMDVTDDAGTGDPDENLQTASGGSDPGENITYNLYLSGGSTRLGRSITAIPPAYNNQPVAENIEALGFAYAIDSDADGDLEVDAGGILWVIEDPAGASVNWFELDVNDDGLITAADDTDSNGTINAADTGIVADPEDIRAIKIWLLGRALRPAQGYSNTSSYVVGNRIITPRDTDPNDSFKRRLLTTSVACKNMGI